MSFEAVVHIRSHPFRKPKKTSLFFFCFLTLCFLTFGVNNLIGANKGMVDKKMITITEENNGKAMEVENGEVFRIELKELGSAGYQWHMEKLDQEYLELVSKETRVLAEGKIGAPVVAIWNLKTKKIGHTEIAMDHYRNWEGKDRASEHFSIRLTIK